MQSKYTKNLQNLCRNGRYIERAGRASFTHLFNNKSTRYLITRSQQQVRRRAQIIPAQIILVSCPRQILLRNKENAPARPAMPSLQQSKYKPFFSGGELNSPSIKDTSSPGQKRNTRDRAHVPETLFAQNLMRHSPKVCNSYLQFFCCSVSRETQN